VKRVERVTEIREFANINTCPECPAFRAIQLEHGPRWVCSDFLPVMVIKSSTEPEPTKIPDWCPLPEVE